MCFSATASFSASAFILGNGIYLLRNREFPFEARYIVSIPFIFSFHQAIEGFVWLGYFSEIPKWPYIISTYLYTFIANSLWPFFIPFAMYCYEKDTLFNKILFLYVIIGAIVSFYLFWAYTFHDPVVAHLFCDSLSCGSLAYLFDIPHFKNSGKILYVSIVLLSLFTTKNKKIRYIFCPAFLFTLVLSSIFYPLNTFISLWCFFSALISFVLIFVFPVKNGAHSINNQSKNLMF